MSKTIAARKGLISIISVSSSYLASLGALWLAKKTGVPVPAELQSEVVAVSTACLAGCITAIMNWWKHK